MLEDEDWPTSRWWIENNLKHILSTGAIPISKKLPKMPIGLGMAYSTMATLFEIAIYDQDTTVNVLTTRIYRNSLSKKYRAKCIDQKVILAKQLWNRLLE